MTSRHFWQFRHLFFSTLFNIKVNGTVITKSPPPHLVLGVTVFSLFTRKCIFFNCNILFEKLSIQYLPPKINAKSFQQITIMTLAIYCLRFFLCKKNLPMIFFCFSEFWKKVQYCIITDIVDHLYNAESQLAYGIDTAIKIQEKIFRKIVIEIIVFLP